MKSLLLICAVFFSATLGIAQNTESDRLLGVWEPSNGKARVKIEKIGEKYYGKIVWLREPNDPNTGQPKVTRTKRKQPNALFL